MHDERVTTTDPFALLAHTYAVALLLGGVTLRTADWEPDRVVVDHDHQVIMISRHLPRWQAVSDAIVLGLRLLCRGRSITTGPAGEPVWADRRRAVGGDYHSHHPPEDPPSSPRLRIVRD